MPYESQRSERCLHDPADQGEDLELRTPDGVLLRATLREPELAATSDAPVPTVVFAHAMFARRSEWERPRGRGLAKRFADRGYRTISFDFRAHGDSAKGPSEHDYDAFVRHDLPTVVACAKDRGGLVIVAGHSLGGHVALASQGSGYLHADALVVAGSNVWHRAFEPSTARFLLLAATTHAIGSIARNLGKFPARALRLGSDDAQPGALSVFVRTTRDGAWRSDDGRDDYFAALTKVDVPVAALLSEGDLVCRPVAGSRFVARTRGPKKVLVVSRGEKGGAPPDHMGLVTTEKCHAAWDETITWAHASARERFGETVRESGEPMRPRM